MMRLILILAPLTIDCSSVDQCTRLCEFDGPAVCTGGSWTKDGGVCHAYLHGGSRGDYCYHTAATSVSCPASGRPVSASEVDRLIAGRGHPGPIASPATMGQNALDLAPVSVTTSAAIDESSSDPIRSAIASLPSRESYFSDVYGDAGVSTSLVSIIDRFTDSVGPMQRWLMARGDDLKHLAETNIVDRPLLIRPFLILVGHICSLPMADCRAFMDQAGVADFFANRFGLEAIRVFIIRHHKRAFLRSIPYQRRRLIAGYVAPLVNVMPSLMDFADTRAIIFDHRVLLYRTSPGHPASRDLVFIVPRASAFVSSVDRLLSSARTHSSNIGVEFNNESGAGRGVVRDWFTEVTLGMHSPSLSLFRQRPMEQPNYMELSPSFDQNRNHQIMYRAVGRFFGLALLHQNPIGLTFPLIFYSKLLGKDLVLDDIREDEPGLYSSLRYINTLTTDTELEPFELTIDDQIHRITMANRAHLIKQKLNSLIDPSVRGNMNLIVDSFREIVPLSTLIGFTPQALQEMIVGDSSIDVDDMMRHVNFSGGYSRNSPQIVWLERLLRDLSNEDRRKFWRFCSSSTQVPVGGFGTLATPFSIHSFGSPALLPTASTCSHQLNLPEYASEADLRRMVTIAINMDSGMGNQ